MVYIFLSLLSILLIFEGFAIPHGREISLYILCSFPLIMILQTMLVKKILEIPKVFSVIYGVFIVCSFISTYYAANVEVAFKYTLVYVSVFFIFITTYNLKSQLIKYVPFFIFLFTACTVCYAFFLTFFTPTHWVDYLSFREYQFVYPSFHTQHPLGRWLIIPTILSFSQYYFSFKKIYFYTFITLCGILFFTYVRAAYVSLFLSTIFIIWIAHKQKNRILEKGKLITVVLSIIFLFLFILTFATVQESRQIPVLKNIHTTLQKHLSLPNKTLLGSRPAFYTNGIIAIQQKPLFGYGPYNLIYAAREHSNSGKVAYTSENIFLEVFAENGIVGGVLFVTLIFLILRSSLSTLQHGEKQLFPFIFVFFGLLMMFQIDSSARFYSFFTMLFFFGGLIYQESNWKVPIANIAVLASSLFILGQLMIVNKIVTNQGNHKVAYVLYPLNEKNYFFLIQEEINNKSYTEAQSLLSRYEFLHKGDKEALSDIHFFYEQIKKSQ